MSKIVMDIVGDIVTIEINLPEEECNIINNELIREIDYWKALALNKYENKLELESNSPKHRVLISRKDKIVKKQVDVEVILNNLKSKYDISVPEIKNYLPSPPKIGEMKRICDIEPHLKVHTSYMNNIENFCLKNAYLLGEWLHIAFRLFRYERYVLKNRNLPSTFEKWLEDNYRLSKTQSYTYKKLANFLNVAPKLLHCRVTVKYLMAEYNILTTYFKNVDSVWCHPMKCICEDCKQYFDGRVTA